MSYRTRLGLDRPWRPDNHSAFTSLILLLQAHDTILWLIFPSCNAWNDNVTYRLRYCSGAFWRYSLLGVVFEKKKFLVPLFILFLFWDCLWRAEFLLPIPATVPTFCCWISLMVDSYSSRTLSSNIVFFLQGALDMVFHHTKDKVANVPVI